jgi:hypothetical protein
MVMFLMLRNNATNSPCLVDQEKIFALVATGKKRIERRKESDISRTSIDPEKEVKKEKENAYAECPCM